MTPRSVRMMDEHARADAEAVELERQAEDAYYAGLEPAPITVIEWEQRCDYSGDRPLDGPAVDLFGRRTL